MKSLLFSLLLLISASVVFAGTQTMSIDAGSRAFMVKLPANPTTGFQWTLVSYDQTFLQLKDSQYIAPQTNRMGAGGEMVFNFIRIKDKPYPKTTQMQFKYARAWEAGSGTEQQVTINFK